MRLPRSVYALVALGVLPSAFAWWSPDWTARKTLTLDTTAAGANLRAPLNDTTLLVRLHQGNFPQFLNVRDGGADFRLVRGDDQTPLKYHVERFDPIGQMAFLWVKLPVVNPQAADKLYLYFANGGAVKGDEPGSSFDPATVAAFHFGEAQGLPVDSTAYATPVASGEAYPNPASIIGPGATLPGTQALSITDHGPLAMSAAQGFSMSAWVRLPAAPGAPVYLFDRQAGANRLSLLLTAGGAVARYNGTDAAASTALTPARWHHVALSASANELRLYVDGALAGSAAIAAADMSGPVLVGGGSDGVGLLAGDVDEVRISNVARSADWFAFEHAVGGERNDAVVTYGADEAAAAAEGAAEEGAHGGYFGIIFQSVFGNDNAIVEQVVIGLCAVMAAIALLVMFFKALYLSRAGGASRSFLRAYQTLPVGGAGEQALESLLKREPRFDISPLFQVYRQALAEIGRRRSPAVGAQPVDLDAKAMGSIRAAMDAVMVRQEQKLNALMVLLTIAISGGPFIGLLGTVVGVMVTFAAIAATGDVNITAIAPGMAAALLATVAGLGVAIPSLFGYNYLGSRIRELSADMHVYADELTARVVEEYGE